MDKCEYCDKECPCASTPAGLLCVLCQISTGFLASVSSDLGPDANEWVAKDFCQHQIRLVEDDYDQLYVDIRPLGSYFGGLLTTWKMSDPKEWERGLSLAVAAIKRHWEQRGVKWQWVRGDIWDVIKAFLDHFEKSRTVPAPIPAEKPYKQRFWVSIWARDDVYLDRLPVDYWISGSRSSLLPNSNDDHDDVSVCMMLDVTDRAGEAYIWARIGQLLGTKMWWEPRFCNPVEPDADSGSRFRGSQGKTDLGPFDYAADSSR